MGCLTQIELPKSQISCNGPISLATTNPTAGCLHRNELGKTHKEWWCSSQVDSPKTLILTNNTLYGTPGDCVLPGNFHALWTINPHDQATCSGTFF